MTLPRLLVLAVTLSGPLAGQYRTARSADYLFAVTAADARALWVNPGGLGVTYDASVMGELVADTSRTGSLALTQVTAGFNSRGIAFGYRRDLYNDTLTGHTWRIGAGRALTRVAVGFALAIHSNGDGPTQRGLDLGVRYRLLSTVELGGTVRDIGKPIVHDSTLNVSGTAGLGWAPMRSLRLDAQGTVTRVTGGGTATGWRGGLAFSLGTLALPLHLQAVLGLNRDLVPTRLALALSLGGRDRVVGVVSGARPGRRVEMDGISLAGIASRVP